MLAIFLISIFSFSFHVQKAWSNASPKVIDGKLDLSTWDFEKNGPLKITGKASFYWKQFLDPYDVAKNGAPPTKLKFDLDGLWSTEKSISSSNKLTTHGYGSYLFKVVGSKKETKSLGFEFSAFSTAYKMFKIENGNVKKLNNSGIIGKNKY